MINKSSMEKSDIFRNLIDQGFNFSNVLDLFIKESGTNKAMLAMKLGVTRQYVDQVVWLKRPGNRARALICKTINFDPFIFIKN